MGEERERDSGDGSISDTWTGKASKEEVLEDLPRIDEKGPSPNRPI